MAIEVPIVEIDIEIVEQVGCVAHAIDQVAGKIITRAAVLGAERVGIAVRALVLLIAEESGFEIEGQQIDRALFSLAAALGLPNLPHSAGNAIEIVDGLDTFVEGCDDIATSVAVRPPGDEVRLNNVTNPIDVEEGGIEIVVDPRQIARAAHPVKSEPAPEITRAPAVDRPNSRPGRPRRGRY